MKICLFCKKNCVRRKSEGNNLWKIRKYCSMRCKYANKKPKVLFICEECNQEKYRLPKNKKQRFCSIKCMCKWRSKQEKLGFIVIKNRNKLGKGKKNPNWKGGITPINEQLRRTKEYKHWRKAIFERDNYTCQMCSKKGGELNADHIKQFALYPELRHELSNGRTLCVPCHRTTFVFYTNQYV